MIILLMIKNKLFVENIKSTLIVFLFFNYDLDTNLLDVYLKRTIQASQKKKKKQMFHFKSM